MEHNDCLVAVYMLAYNHEKYIRKAIESVLMQKTSFKFKLIIHDDASNDNTQMIIEEYAKKNPDIIIPILQKENKQSKGISVFHEFILPYIKTPYIASCEGDDYWIDEYKLQKQIDFLERHSDFVAVGHNVKFVDDDGCDYLDVVPKEWTKMPDYEYTIRHANKHYVFAQTASRVYRNFWLNNYDYLVNLYLKATHVHGDMKISILCVCLGRVWVMKEVMSCYRKSLSNNSYSASSKGQNQCKRKVLSLQEKKNIGKSLGVIFSFKKEYKKNLFNSFCYAKKRKNKEDIDIYKFVLKEYPYHFPKLTIAFYVLKYSFSRIWNRIVLKSKKQVSQK